MEPITPEDITPAAPPAATATTDEEGEVEIPDEVLQIPAITGLLEGKPAATYSPEGVKDPAIDVVLKNAKALMAAGFGFYQTKDGKNNVLFNAAYLTEDELKQADAAGKLDEVAAPLGELKASFDAALAGGSGDAAAGGAPPAAGAASGPPASPAAQKKVTTARLKAVQQGSPTSGMRPGAGRILNSITSPVV